MRSFVFNFLNPSVLANLNQRSTTLHCIYVSGCWGRRNDWLGLIAARPGLGQACLTLGCSSSAGLLLWGAGGTYKHCKRGVLLDDLDCSTLLAVIERNGKTVVYLGEIGPGHVRRTRVFTWRKSWIRDWLVCVCFGCSLSNTFPQELHVSSLTGSLMLSTCLPWTFPSICLFLSPSSLSLPWLPWARFAGVPLLQKSCCHLPGAVTDTRCQVRAWDGDSLVPMRIQGHSCFRKKHLRHAGLLAPCLVWSISSSSGSTALGETPRDSPAPVRFWVVYLV